MEKNTLNKNDEKLLGFCWDQKRSIREIARFLEIAPKNVSVRLKGLKELGLIEVNKKGQGKKTLVRASAGNTTKSHFITLLREIDKRGGVTEEEYSSLLPCDISNPREQDRFSATLQLPFIRPKLIQRKIFITPEGKLFLKKHGEKLKGEKKKNE